MYKIYNVNELTNEFVLNISNEAFIQTQAFNTFGKKDIFINKIHDQSVRYTMLKNIITIVKN